MAEAFINNIDGNLWTKLISDSFSDSVTKYEKADDVVKYITGTLDVSGLKCSKSVAEYTSDEPVYNIAAGDTVLLKITLSQSGKSGFGFPAWDVSDIMLQRENIAPELHEVSITAPNGAHIFLNGVAADDKCLIGKAGGISVFETSADSLYSVWKVEGLYQTPEIKAEYADAELFCTADGDSFFCDYPSEMRSSYKITVPSGASVFVNGIAAGDEYITKSGIPYTYSVFESGLTKLPDAVMYTIDGLLRKPVVSVKLNGETLTDSGGYLFDYPKSQKYNVSLEVPQGASVYLNDVLVSGGYIAKDNMPSSRVDLSAFTKYLTAYPLFTRYYADGLYVKPKITVMYNGDELEAYDNIDIGYTLSLKYDCKTSGKQNEQYSAEALSFAKDYIYYMARGKSETDVNAGLVLAHMLAGTDAYKMIEMSQDSVKYITPYEKIVYNSIEAMDFTGYTDECFACKVVFDVSLINYGVSMDYAGVYELLYIIKDGIPYVADITITGKN
jgi:hypothetical protein